ncbi:MAG: hypothetical protein GY838_03330 [bacterium]|nr:hypothetical protein [bacterium]
MRAAWCLVLVILLASGSAAWAEDFDYEHAIYWWRGSFGEAWTTQDGLEFVMAKRLGHSAFVHEYPFLSLVSFVRHERPDGSVTEAFNFRGMACALTLAAASGLDGRPVFGAKPEPGWWTRLLMAHNNTWKLRLNRSLRLTAITRTDLPLANFPRQDRGLLFTPQLGFELVGLSAGYEGEDPPPTNRLHVGVGRRYWMGFDGERRTEGWVFVVGVAFLAGV